MLICPNKTDLDGRRLPSTPNLTAAVVIKLVSAGVGLTLVILSLSYFVNEFGYLLNTGFPGLADVIIIISILGALLSGIALSAELPNSLRVRFHRLPFRRKPERVYGFGTVLAIGVGATLGSPLFILIPLNVVQYQVASIGSLIIATILSILMARIYGRNYAITKRNKLDSVGGPGFLKAAAGKRSFRYFFSRVSMAVGNIAVAAYSAIVFVLFDFQVLPGILSSFGIVGLVSQFFRFFITALFVGWFLLNSVFETKFISLIGKFQIVFTSVLVVILVSNSALMGANSAWSFSGLLSFAKLPGGNLPYALLINTSYLYLLFFGFQEIQALERETRTESEIPVVSWFKRNLKLSNTSYISLAMITSVLIASAINIFYGLATYSAHPSLEALQASQIPALYLAKVYLGIGMELAMSVAFLIATFTTFVPSFLAASRHISSLAEDGFMPESLSKMSWVFVLVSIGILSVAGENFLISITDFMVLVSLGMIALSAIWLAKGRVLRLGKTNLMPAIVGIACFVAAASVYLFDPSVAVFGAFAVLVAYLLFDVFELGSLGVELFLGIFNLVIYSFLTTYSHDYVSQNFLLFRILGIPPLSADLLAQILLLASVLLLANFALNVSLRVRTQPRSRQIAQN